MPKKLKIGVLMGGPSLEHDVSLATGKQILENLDNEKYKPVTVKISRTGKWMLNGKSIKYIDALSKIDFALLALHGEFGEDGRIQALLEFHDVPYSGSGIGASALAMDKMQSREIFKLAGLRVPKTLHIKKDETQTSLIKFFTSKVSKFPVVVKPNNRGSSVGISIVKSEEDLTKAVKSAFKFAHNVLIEEYLKGAEVTCGVIDNFNNQKYFALPVTQIIPLKHKFFNYRAKYISGATKEITPAPLDEDIYMKVQQAALRAHQLLGCSGYSRTDMIIKNGGTVYVIELNTLPGMTQTSLLPQQASAVGLAFPQLLDKIIENSFS